MVLSFINKILKSFSSPETEPVLVEVKDAELSSWFEKEAGKKVTTFKSRIDSANAKVSEHKAAFKGLVKALEEGTLRNKNIPQRAFDIMEGNRSTYIHKVTNFVEPIKIPEDAELLNSFFEEISSSLEDLNKATSRSYYVLQEFFANEARKIAMKIKDFETIFNKLEEESKSESVFELSKTKKKIKDYHGAKETKRELESRKKNKQAELKSHEKELDELNSEQDKITASEDYKSYLALEEKKLELEKTQELARKDFLNVFSTLETALKKYERMTIQVALVKSYLDNPVKGVVNDSGFEIIETLSKMRSAILNNSLNLKDKKQKKTLESIDFMNHDYFQDFAEKEKNISNEISEAVSALEIHPASASLTSVKEKIEKKAADTAHLEKEFDLISQECDSINLEKMKADLESLLSRVLSSEIKIS